MINLFRSFHFRTIKNTKDAILKTIMKDKGEHYVNI